MKKAFSSSMVLFCFATLAQQNPPVSPAGESSPVIVERGANHQRWEIVEREDTPLGKPVERVRGYTELETGMHVKQADGSWKEASAQIELTAEGAAATNTQFQVFFAANLNTADTAGPVRLVTPEGKHLNSRILGLSFFDGERAVLIAETKESIGLLVGQDRVWYTNAFDNADGVDATVEYVVTKAGLSQNIILKSLPSPAEYQLNPQTTRLQVLTEFYDPPVPGKSVEIAATGLADEFLDFGEMKITRNGRAFSVSEDGETDDFVPVSKQWTEKEGRQFLVEEVPFNAVDAQIRALSQKPRTASLSPGHQGKGENVIAALREVLPKRTAQQTTGKMRMAKLAPGVRSPAFTRSVPPEGGTPNQAPCLNTGRCFHVLGVFRSCLDPATETKQPFPRIASRYSLRLHCPPK